MKTSKLLFLLLSFLLVSSAHAGPEVDRLLSEYEKIETVTCQIRRTKEGPAGKVRFLSRVYWKKGGYIHAEGIAPVKRRTIADGKALFQYNEGAPKGFSRPIETLSEPMAISLKLIPGTAMDHLLRLKGLDEQELPAQEDSTKRIGIQAENNYAVLLLDEAGRLTGIDFFERADMLKKTAGYTYRDHTEAAGAWVPLTHEAVFSRDGSDFKETVRVDRFITNNPVAESLFIASSFFDKNIDFVDDFAKIFPD
ncbi:MAG TPA: hypothetical protein VIR63_06505 [Pontiella sp.]